MGSAWLFGIAYTIPLSLVVGLVLQGPWVLATVVYVFVMTPTLDAWLGVDRRNPEASSEPERRGRWLFDAWLYAWLPTQVALLGWTIAVCTRADVTAWEIAGLVVSMGVVSGGGGITVAHELMHRSRGFEKALAELLMASVSYPHFCIEHVFGHHRWVATPHDPATARFGQSLYAFLPQTLVGGVKSFWRIETERVRRKKLRGLADARLRYPLLVWAFVVLAGGFWGGAGIAVFFAQSVVAVLLLESINYVEHYGLQRREADRGRYERVLPKHSWNSDHWLTGLYLFNLPRHADHHYLASRPYPVLRHLDDSPQLPAGYSTMVLVAAVPPLWHAVMDDRVRAWNARHDDGGLAAQA